MVGREWYGGATAAYRGHARMPVTPASNATAPAAAKPSHHAPMKAGSVSVRPGGAEPRSIQRDNRTPVSTKPTAEPTMPDTMNTPAHTQCDGWACVCDVNIVRGDHQQRCSAWIDRTIQATWPHTQRAWQALHMEPEGMGPRSTSISPRYRLKVCLSTDSWRKAGASDIRGFDPTCITTLAACTGQQGSRVKGSPVRGKSQGRQGCVHAPGSGHGNEYALRRVVQV